MPLKLSPRVNHIQQAVEKLDLVAFGALICWITGTRFHLRRASRISPAQGANPDILRD